MDAQHSTTRDWWKIGDGAVLLAYVCVVLWTIRYHEKWADEAQAWLIARDLDLKTIWFHELRYEGSPGLWHTILWVAQHVFHARYGALGYIGLAFAIAGTAVLLFLAPFPRIVRWPLAFTYVMIYQYAVIARPYTLLPLLAFCAAIFFKDARRPERITIVLVLLALLTLHGAILAGCLGAAYAIEAFKLRSELEPSVKRRYFLCTGVLLLTFIFVAGVVKPTPDVEEFVVKQQLAKMPQPFGFKQPTWDVKLVSIISGAFLDYTAISLVFIALTALWCALRRKLLVFVLPVTLLTLLYVAIHGYAHHHGTVTVAVFTALWIAWPKEQENALFSTRDRRLTYGMVALLVIFCALQISDSAVVINHEYLYPYSGAQDAANFLKSENAQQRPIFGLLYGIVGVQAYFDHNIFANIPTTYFHHGAPFDGTNLDVSQLARMAPGFVVVFTEQPQLMIDSGGVSNLLSAGYRMVHFSDGYMLYRKGVYVRQTYLIFRRTDWETAHGLTQDGLEKSAVDPRTTSESKKEAYE